MKFIDWKEFTSLCDKLSEDIAEVTIDGIVGIGRGGLIIGGILAHRKDVPLYPVFVRHQGFTEDTPVVVEDLGKIKSFTHGTILIADDVMVTGKAMNFVKSQIHSGVTVKTLVVVCHKSAKEKPDYVGIVMDDLPVFPYEI
ncbi:MAG: Pribosyltran protein [Thermoproteota archaeon]|nr:Pribosyltran protein [Thermoproteota archaeon]